MEDFDINKLKDAGKASAEALSYAKGVVKPGKSIAEAAEEIENFIKAKGFGLSFPVNLSVNDQAAHYTPELDDRRSFTEKDVVKVDLGARKEQYLTDCAVTIDLSGSYSKLADAAEEALQNALSLVKAGRPVREIGREINATAEKHGFRPIRNLGGHGITELELHSDIFIPNFDNGDGTELQEGQVIAIEPFITDGKGYVEEGAYTAIFQKNALLLPRSQEAREVNAFIDKNFLTYPFATRWLARDLNHLGDFRIRKGIAELQNAGVLEAFPVLIEKTRGIVSQAEKTLLVEKDSCQVITG